MRVSVMQMNPGANKTRQHRPGPPPDRDRRSSRTAPTSSACPKSGTSLGGDRATRTANAELLPAKGSNEPGGEAYEFLRETARAAQGPCARRLDHRAGAGKTVQHHRGVQPGRHGTRALPQDPPVRHRRPRRHRLPRKQQLRRRRRGRDLRGGRREGRLRDLLRRPLSRPVLETARAGRRADLPAQRLYPGDRQGPLGGADPRPRDRDPVLVRRPGNLGHAPGGQGRTPPHLRPLDGGQPLGACGRAGVGRHRLDHRADRPGPSPRGCAATCRSWRTGNAFERPSGRSSDRRGPRLPRRPDRLRRRPDADRRRGARPPGRTLWRLPPGRRPRWSSRSAATASCWKPSTRCWPLNVRSTA